MRNFAACLLEDEALWLGLQAVEAGRGAEIHAALLEMEDSHRRIRRLHGRTPPDFSLAEGNDASSASAPPFLFHQAPLGLLVRAGGASARLILLAPEDFAAATGAPPPEPIRPGDGYGGWRLP